MSNYPYNVGDIVVLTWELRVTGVLTNATSAVLTLRSPAGVETSPSVTNPAAGKYQALVPATEAGLWRHRFVSTGPAAGAEEGFFQVSSPTF